jgi:hypothetical protein
LITIKVLCPLVDSIKTLAKKVFSWCYNKVLAPSGRALYNGYVWVNKTIISPSVKALRYTFPHYVNHTIVEPTKKFISDKVSVATDHIKSAANTALICLQSGKTYVSDKVIDPARQTLHEAVRTISEIVHKKFTHEKVA